MSAVSLLHPPVGGQASLSPGLHLRGCVCVCVGGGGLGERTADISESMKTILPW